jgi:biopolymer transport protein ExbB
MSGRLVAYISFWLLLLANPVLFAADLDEVKAALTRDIQNSQRELAASETSIGQDRAELSRRINAAQNRVLELRDRTVAARRLADEETLSLSQIETRLALWREQGTFQARLVSGFLNRSGQGPFSGNNNLNVQDDLQTLAAYLREQEARLYPSWQQQTLVLADGQVTSGELLQLGPVQVFWLDGKAGLAQKQQDMVRSSLLFEGEALTGIASLYAGGNGILTFDPTLSRALLLAEENETLLQHLQKGGIWAIPILLFALFATTIAACKAVSLWRLPKQEPALAERAEAALQEGKTAVASLMQRVQGQQRELLHIALKPGQTTSQRDDRLYAKLLEQRNALERWLGAIAMTAAVSPLLGLLGTVSGMIATFKLMTLFGAGDPSAVSSGISEALVTTELGLVVAIPALLAHALMSRRVKNYFSRLENDAVHLSQLPVQEINK